MNNGGPNNNIAEATVFVKNNELRTKKKLKFEVRHTNDRAQQAHGAPIESRRRSAYGELLSEPAHRISSTDLLGIQQK